MSVLASPVCPALTAIHASSLHTPHLISCVCGAMNLWYNESIMCVYNLWILQLMNNIESADRVTSVWLRMRAHMVLAGHSN